MRSILLYSFCWLGLGVFAQTIPERCATQTMHLRMLQQNPNLQQHELQFEDMLVQYLQAQQNNKEQNIVYTIPVVVHVVYNNAAQNISDAQIQSQIAALNKDYRKLNSNQLSGSHPFYSLIGDAQIEFCLATVDPDGRATSGITRTNTTVSEFVDDDLVKSNSTGGENAWDATQYLNIWVCKLGNSLLGYAQLPSSFALYPETDGVVIHYAYFGTMGTSTYPYNQGRTATHEIGHWLGLKHIWGDDDNCSGDDGISDTPNQKTETYGCPSGIRTDDCSPNSPGILYENYMDYTDDACMSMFTINQVTKMRAIINTTRSRLLTQPKCSSTTGIQTQNNSTFLVYPNPVSRYITLEGVNNNSDGYLLEIISIDGRQLYATDIDNHFSMIELPDLETGNYILKVSNSRAVYITQIQVR